MSEHLYTEYPELYDAMQADWDYERDVSFVLAALETHDQHGDRLLEVGCGTGEHTRRLAGAGFDVTAVDKYEGMLSRAREKCCLDTETGDGYLDTETGDMGEVDSTAGLAFHRKTLPDLPDGEYDVAVAIRGVINHLAPAELEPAFRSLADRLVEGGVLVFDNSRLPPEGNQPALDVGVTEYGSYGRVVQMAPRTDGRLDWQALLFVPEENAFFVDSRPMTPFADATITETLSDVGFEVETHDGFGPDDNRTVFVAVL